MARALDRTLMVIFALLLLFSVRAMTTGWHHTILDQYGFRQAQTATTIAYLLRGGPWVAYETPVLGPPWSIPFEFPLYQWIVALVVWLFRVPIDQAGRLISALFFFASLLPLFFLLRRLGLTRSQTWPFLISMVVSPLYIFWSRTVMIESCALFLSLTYLAAAAEYLYSPRTAIAALILFTGVLAAMVKLPTFFGFALCGALLLLGDRYRRSLLDLSNLRTHIVYAVCAGVVPFLAGYSWSLYAEAQRTKNPLSGFLALDALVTFTYGTLRQRFSPELWHVVWSRSIPDILGSNLLILPLLICLPFVNREVRGFALASMAMFFIVWMTFTNLHYVHSYYQYANGVFLIAALGFTIAGLIEINTPARVSGLVLLGATVLLGVTGYRHTYEKSQQSDNRSLQGTAKVIRENSDIEDAVIVYGMDWSPELLYSSARRGIMVRDGRGPESAPLQRAVTNLGNRKIGALAVCLTARMDLATVRRSTCRYGLGVSPRYEDAICSVYLPVNDRASATSCAEQPAAAPGSPLSWVDQPVAGATIAGSVSVIGWALSQAGVQKIDILLDGQPANTATLGFRRPDVQQAYPHFQNSLHAGFHGAIDLRGVEPGSHTVGVELHANDGSRHPLASIPVILVR
jgi:hypothetical protein